MFPPPEFCFKSFRRRNKHKTCDKDIFRTSRERQTATMFAEELGGNATRKRQEEARTRRRKLKQQQEQQKRKAQQAALSAKTGEGESTAVDDKTAATAKVEGEKPAFSGTNVTNFEESADPSNNAKPSAVANALQQRQQRQQAQAQQKAATRIQSFFRAHRSNVKLLKDQTDLLVKRLKDLSTLKHLLKQKTKTEYIPPPATTSALCTQMIFISTELPYKRKGGGRKISIRDPVNDALKLHLLIQNALLPALYSSDENVNPALVWLQSAGGKVRLESILRIILLVATSSAVDEAVLGSCTSLLNAVLSVSGSGQVPAPIVKFCRSRLFSKPQHTKTPSLSSTRKGEKMRVQLFAKLGTPLDLVSILRHHLLYFTGGPEPIPAAADRVRESCIPQSHKKQADALFQTLLGAIEQVPSPDERKILLLRFTSEILTVPLLTWKTSDKSISMLLDDNKHNTNGDLLLVSMIKNFTAHHGPQLREGEIDLTLCSDVSLTTCPATPTQCLMANLMLIGRSSVRLNGSDASKLDFNAAAEYFNFIATLVDALPLGTFSSRESVVQWISDGKGHHSPVVLSPVIIQQCKVILVDAFIRKLFFCAIDEKALKTEEILLQKNDKDLKQEKALQEQGGSAASLAAKEARIDRSKGFWNSSAWAKKMTKGVTKILSLDKGGGKKGEKKTESKLTNTSLVSRKLAQVGSKKLAGDSPTADAESADTDPTRMMYTTDLLISLCRVYGIILARWGGGGGEDLVKRARHSSSARTDSKGAHQERATTKADICAQSLLNVICFSTSAIRALWAIIQSDNQIVANIYTVIDSNRGSLPVRCLSIRPSYSERKSERSTNAGAVLLFVFVSALSHMLIVTDDTEIHDMERPIPLHQLRRCIQTLKQILYRACCIDDTNLFEGFDDSSKDSDYFGLALIHASTRTMRDLYDRSSRRPFCIPKLWLIEDLMEKEIRRCGTESEYVALLSTPVLRVCPFLVSFKRRLKLFERIVYTGRVAIQGENSQNPFNTNPLKPGIPVRITRGRILEDGLATMNHLGRNMRQRIAVQYHNEAGMRESGVDAGGLFKEFWTDLSAIAFDPNYALFRVTEGNCMYPSPSSAAAHGTDHVVLFEFLGRILGKALYEGITIHPQFAHFFLSFLRGNYNYFHMLPDLSTIDDQLYNNLMFLKNYEGDAEDLCLTFTVANDDFGGNTEIPLIPNGANVSVTNTNKQRYVGLVAKYYVVDRLKEQSEAFTRGLWDVIDRSWLQIFNEPELQILISGPTDGKIDIDDMRSNCRYAGGFTGIDRSVNRFWSALASFSPKQQADLLRFVTSCERPPPLGFAFLNPPFTIQRVGILRDGDKLPTSSTCFNTLKLPTYSSEKVMKERLLYAIEAGAGFELT